MREKVSEELSIDNSQNINPKDISFLKNLSEESGTKARISLINFSLGLFGSAMAKVYLSLLSTLYSE
jgi:hypothetical protein